MSKIERKLYVECHCDGSTNECALISELRELITKEHTLNERFDSYGEGFWLSGNLTQDAQDLLHEMCAVYGRKNDIKKKLGICEF